MKIRGRNRHKNELLGSDLYRISWYKLISQRIRLRLMAIPFREYYITSLRNILKFLISYIKVNGQCNHLHGQPLLLFSLPVTGSSPANGFSFPVSPSFTSSSMPVPFNTDDSLIIKMDGQQFTCFIIRLVSASLLLHH